MRSCGECNLCCKLLPVPPLNKVAGTPCKWQRHRKGCAVYGSRNKPLDCKLWNCRWLVNDDADDLSRPDRARYVIDIMPDFVTHVDNATDNQIQIEVVQIWIDPKHPYAHRDPALRRWIERRAEQGIAALIRFNNRDGLVVFAPPFDKNGKWHEISSNLRPGPQHSFAEIKEALGERASPFKG
jgi:hypothetical protein